MYKVNDSRGIGEKIKAPRKKERKKERRAEK